MEDQTGKLESADQFREAVGILAVEVVRLKEVQAAQGELLKRLDERLRLLVKATDALVGPPKPSGGRDVAN